MQSATKSGCCWYYAFNFLRRRIGKNPCSELAKERQIEQICSQRRKEVTAHDDSFPIKVESLFSKSDILILQNLDPKNAQLFLKDPTSVLYNQHDTKSRPSIKPYIEEFLKEKKHKDLHEFLVHKWSCKHIEINKKFLGHFFNNINSLLKIEDPSNLKIEEKAATLDSYVLNLHADLYGLSKSTWKPIQGAVKLIDELTNKGPLMIFGYFGNWVYIDPPFKMETPLAGRDIYAWHPGAKRYISSVAHTVVLIGAKKIEDKAYVYFIDPNNASDPRDLSTQKIYLISFTNLTKYICDLDGYPEKDSNKGYAFCGNFKLT